MHEPLWRSKRILLDYYCNKGISSRKIAKVLHTSHRTILKYLTAYGIKRRSNILPLPEKSKVLTSEKAYLLGAICGDGCLHKSRVFKKRITKQDTPYYNYILRFSVTDKDFMKEFIYCFEKVFSYVPKVYFCSSEKENNKDVHTICINRKEIFIEFYKLIYANHYKWHVPESILISQNLDIIESFLRGFADAEGSVDKRYGYISLCSTNKNGLNQVKYLFDKIGIKTSRICISKHNKFSTNHTIYITSRPQMYKFNNYVGFCIKRKQYRLQRRLINYGVFIKARRNHT